jgi:hypothetical protein
MLENLKAYQCLLCENLEDEMNENETGNQQERLESILDLAWLGGIIDGEGTFTLRIHGRKKNRLLISAVFTITNTDFVITDNIERILRENNIPFWVSERKTQDKNPNWKPAKEIVNMGIRRLLKFIPVILPYLVGKKEEAEIVYEFCDRRVKMLGNRSYYTKEDLELVTRVKALHGHSQGENDFRILNDYALNIRENEDIVCPE